MLLGSLNILTYRHYQDNRLPKFSHSGEPRKEYRGYGTTRVEYRSGESLQILAHSGTRLPAYKDSGSFLRTRHNLLRDGINPQHIMMV